MKILIKLIFLYLISTSNLFAQGCSDAGICSISNFYKFDSNLSKRNSLEIGYIFGKGLEEVIYNNCFLTYSRVFNKSWSFNSKLTYNQASGNFGTLGRLGDVFIVLNYNRELNKNISIKPSFGLKIPLSASNFKINGITLPLDYQASLGSVDALFGIDYKYKKWSFDAALQLPLLHINRNSYFDEYSISNDFPTTNLFKRKPDVLFRSGYTLTKNQIWSFKPTIMAIYHLSNDSYEDVFSERQTLENSIGFTVNANLISEFYINSNNILWLNIASPLFYREVRPDGLTRSFLTSLSYQLKF